MFKRGWGNPYLLLNSQRCDNNLKRRILKFHSRYLICDKTIYFVRSIKRGLDDFGSTRFNCRPNLLWSQIKLTSYDFSDLHITGEFDNRPGTGRFLRIFSCVVTYPTGAGRRLYMKTLTDAAPGRFYTCNNEYIYIKFRHHSSKETG